MNLSCPHCSQMFELTPEVHAQLQGQPHFACPLCQGMMAVPPQHSAPPQSGPRRPSSAAAQAAAMRMQRGQHKNLLVLGVVALLALGGIGVFLASHNGGSVFNIFQNTTNQVIHNSYFTQLIASGVTTEKDLKALAEIRPYGDGFIGISKESLPWNQAQDLAKRTGAEILEIETGADDSGKRLLEWLASSFVSHISSTVWVGQQGEVRVFDGKDVLVVTSLSQSRRILLQWAAPKNRDDALALVTQFGGHYKKTKNSQGNLRLEITLTGTRPDTEFLRRLKNLPHLEFLDLSGCPVGDDMMAVIGELSELTDLFFWAGGGTITDDGLKHLAGLTKLTRINLGGAGPKTITGSGLVHLKGLTNLRMVALNALDKIEDRYLTELAALPNIEYLSLGCAGITGACLGELSRLPKLAILDLRNSKVTDERLQDLKGMTQLTSLFLVNTPVTDKGIVSLKQLTHLKLLELKDTRITDAGVAELQAAISGLKVTR